jgi:hypothetical protein
MHGMCAYSNIIIYSMYVYVYVFGSILLLLTGVGTAVGAGVGTVGACQQTTRVLAKNMRVVCVYLHRCQSVYRKRQTCEV